MAMNTPDAETASANLLVRSEVLLALVLWELILSRIVVAKLWEDSQATIRQIFNGYSLALRHLSRTAGIHLAWLSQVIVPNKVPRDDPVPGDPQEEVPPTNHIDLEHCRTTDMLADIFTKPILDAGKLKRVVELLSLLMLVPKGPVPWFVPEPSSALVS